MNKFTTQCFVVVAVLLLLLLLRTRQIVSSCFVEFVHFVLLPLLCYALLRSLLTSAHFVGSLQTACRVRHVAPFYKQRSLNAVAALLSQYSLSCSGCCALALSLALPLALALFLIWCPALLVCLDCSRLAFFVLVFLLTSSHSWPKKNSVARPCLVEMDTLRLLPSACEGVRVSVRMCVCVCQVV